MNENAICQKIIKELNAVPLCRARKRHGGKFMSGDPDIAGVYKGRAFFIEVKMENGKLTPLQANQLDAWRATGANTRVAVYDADLKKIKLFRVHGDHSWKSVADRDLILWQDGVWTLHAIHRTSLQEYLNVIAQQVIEYI
jgi:hypothetical protein